MAFTALGLVLLAVTLPATGGSHSQFSLTGMIATLISCLVAYYVAVLSSRFGLDPDNQSVPVITSVMDLAGVVSFLLVLSLLGVVTHG